MLKRAVITLTVAFAIAAGSVSAQSGTDPELRRLRENWAQRFLEPDPHMELAKYFRERGNRLQAFYILENARRNRFDQKAFDAAYLRHFGGHAPLDNSKTEEDKYLKLINETPEIYDNIDRLADIYISRDDFVRAEPLLKRLLEKWPERVEPSYALAEIYTRQGRRDAAEKLLDDYANHFPETSDGYLLRFERLSKSDPVAAGQLLDAAVKKFPSDGRFVFQLALSSQKDGDLAVAAERYETAARLEPHSEGIQGQTAVFFARTSLDKEKALHYYLNTYFLNPHAHYGGHAEAMISKLNLEIAEQKVKTAIASGVRPADLLLDANPMVVVGALTLIADSWASEQVPVFVGLLQHDEVTVRWFAMEFLVKKEGHKLDQALKDLLLHKDLRVRGLAAYMAVRLRKRESFPEMRKMLNSDAQVLRFDAISALMMYGGPDGKAIVREHMSKEQNAFLRTLMERSLQ